MDNSNYQEGKIYSITGGGKTYIGSTCDTLPIRLRSHLSKQDSSSKEVLGYADTKINLLENYPCNSKQELRERERVYFDLTDCVNVNKPFVTEIERINRYRDYHAVNREKIKVRNKAYYEANREHAKVINKAYREANREANREKIKVRNKAYYEANKSKHKAYYEAKKSKIKGCIIENK